MVRICTGEVWVRSTWRLPSRRSRQIEGVLLLPRRMLGRDVERGEIVEIVLDVGPFGDGEAHLAEDRDELVDGLADRMDAALGLGPHRQRDVDPLAGEPRARAPRRRAAPAAASSAASISSLSTLSARAALAARLGRERAQALHQLGDAALLAEGGDAHLLERVAARRRLIRRQRSRRGAGRTRFDPSHLVISAQGSTKKGA